MTTDYASRARWLWLAEPAADPLSEAELSLIWQGKRYPPAALQTADGRRVDVLYPGRRAGGAGPDFRDSVVVVRGERRLGDVELHVRASAFQQHGHHLDPAYDGLVLHVVFLDDGGGRTRLCSGGEAPVAAFAPWVERRSADVAAWLGRPSLWHDPCASAVSRLGGGEVRARLEAAGLQRFDARAGHLRRMAGAIGLEEALWRGVMEALGYGGDRAGFLELAARLPLAALRASASGVTRSERQAQVEAALLAAAGLGAAGAGGAAISRPLRPTGLRPANRPERRLAAAAALLDRAGMDLLAYASRTLGETASPRELVAAWTVAAAHGPALVGPDRARELLLNAVLPCLALLPETHERARTFAATLPALPAYGRTRFLEDNLRGEARRFIGSALEQQGLLALQAEWCSRGGCGRCPLS